MVVAKEFAIIASSCSCSITKLGSYLGSYCRAEPQSFWSIRDESPQNWAKACQACACCGYLHHLRSLTGRLPIFVCVLYGPPLVVQAMAKMELAALPTAKLCLLTSVFDSVYRSVMMRLRIVLLVGGVW